MAGAAGQGVLRGESMGLEGVGAGVQGVLRTKEKGGGGEGGRLTDLKDDVRLVRVKPEAFFFFKFLSLKKILFFR